MVIAMIYKLWFVNACRWMVTEDFGGGHNNLMTSVEVATINEKNAKLYYKFYCDSRKAALLPIESIEIVCLNYKTKKEIKRKVL